MKKTKQNKKTFLNFGAKILGNFTEFRRVIRTVLPARFFNNLECLDTVHIVENTWFFKV